MVTDSTTILKQFGKEKRAHYSLEKIRAALESVGNPQLVPHTLIVGGTNGKGSCTLLISAGLAEVGFRVHSYLSPHLSSPTERFLTNLVPISEVVLTGWLQHLLPVAQKYELSYFEFLTLVAFVRAREEKADFLILEVGLGGRLDATNLCAPLGSVIASIGLDHQNILGPDEANILREKLGIVRPEGLLFTGVERSDLVEQIEKHCAKLDAIPYYSRELRAQVLERGFWGQRVTINGYPFELNCPTEATLSNTKTALLALRILFPKYPVSTFQRAFRRVRFPARFETVQAEPRVILSGDHNPQAMHQLLASLREHAQERGKIRTLAAFSPDKDFAHMIPLLQGVSHQFILTYIPDHESLMPPSYESFGPRPPRYEDWLAELIGASAQDDTVLVTGSLYLVGAVRPIWEKQVSFYENLGRSLGQSAEEVASDVTAAGTDREYFPYSSQRPASDLGRETPV